MSPINDTDLSDCLSSQERFAATDGLCWFNLKTGKVTPAPRREDVPVSDAQDKTRKDDFGTMAILPGGI